MRAVASGDGRRRERAFRELVRRHAGAVRGVVGAILRDREAAEDVLQDALLRVFEARERYEPGRAAFRTWLCRIARNLALNHHRDRRRRGERGRREADGGDAVADAGPGPLERLIGAQRAAALRAAVGRLPARDREVIELRFGQELPFAEIAQIVGASEAAVKQRAWRALGRLREQLGEGQSR